MVLAIVYANLYKQGEVTIDEVKRLVRGWMLLLPISNSQRDKRYRATMRRFGELTR